MYRYQTPEMSAANQAFIALSEAIVERAKNPVRPEGLRRNELTPDEQHAADSLVADGTLRTQWCGTQAGDVLSYHGW